MTNEQKLIAEWLKTNKPTIVPIIENKCTPYKGPLIYTNSRSTYFTEDGEVVHVNLRNNGPKYSNPIVDETMLNYG